MRKCRNWVLGLALMAAAPGITCAALPFKSAGAAANNQQVANEIGAALQQAGFRGEGVELEYKNGVATLTGKVANDQEKAKAADVMKRFKAVKQFNNQLAVASDQSEETPFGNVQPAGFESQRGNAGDIEQVGLNLPKNPVAAGQRAAAPKPPTNQQMAEKVAGSLEAAGLAGTEIRVRFTEGKAILDGSVNSPAQKSAASKAAESVAGVKGVDNRLTVAGSGEAADARRQRSPYVNTAFQAPAPGEAPAAPAPGAPAPGAPAPGAPAFGGPGPGSPMAPNGFGPPGGMPPYGPGVPPGAMGGPPAFGAPGMGGGAPMYSNPYVPDYAWPSYAAYPNSAAITYPKQYSASAWPYIGPFYPYPQVPLGWRAATLEWDDGYWNLNFRSRTDKWWWFLQPKNW